MPLRVQSAIGLLAMIAIAWLLSAHKTKVRPRIVLGGLVMQFLFAVVVLKTTPGRLLFSAANEASRIILECVNAGSMFVFGETYEQHFFAFKVLPSIIFFSALMGVLHHWRIIPLVVRLVGGAMRLILGTSGAESLSAAANILWVRVKPRWWCGPI